jgi:metallophosphoesterase superfamily enzyme
MAEVELVERVKAEHVGRWIALRGKDVVVVSDTHDEIYKELKEKGMSDVYVFYSPTKEQKKYGFLF